MSMSFGGSFGGVMTLWSLMRLKSQGFPSNEQNVTARSSSRMRQAEVLDRVWSSRQVTQCRRQPCWSDSRASDVAFAKARREGKWRDVCEVKLAGFFSRRLDTGSDEKIRMPHECSLE